MAELTSTGGPMLLAVAALALFALAERVLEPGLRLWTDPDASGG